MKIMASGPITSWQIDGETMATVTDFIFFGSKITADSDWSNEIKRHLLLGVGGSYDKPRQHIKKQKHHLTDKVHIVKFMHFPVAICEYESWAVEKTDC